MTGSDRAGERERTDAAGDRAGAVVALRGELDELAAGSGLTRAEVGGTVEYRAGGFMVAVAEVEGLAFRLGAEVARAAAATPDASPSPRGPDWVRFAPATLDRFTLDRATAWFELAVRLGAVGEKGRAD